MPDQATPQVLLSFDFGMKRIGVAVGQSITATAQPLATLAARDGVPDWNIIQQHIDTWHVDAFVIGIPYNMDGSDQDITFAARRFGRKLQGRFHLPVFEVDERLTTKEARRLAAEDVRLSDADIDSIAAKLILESWLRTHS